MMTRILRFTCALDPLYGGVPQGVSLISRETSVFGISNVIVSLGNSKSARLRNANNIEGLRSSGVNVIETHSFFSNPYGLGNILPQVSAFLKMEKPNLVVIHQIWTFATLFGYIYSRLYSIELAVMPHGSLSKYHESKSSFIKFIARKIFISKVLPLYTIDNPVWKAKYKIAKKLINPGQPLSDKGFKYSEWA